MTKEEILEGIAAYSEQQNEIKQAIIDCGGKLTEREFDKKFGDGYEELMPNGDLVYHRNPIKISIWPYAPKAFLLGSMQQPGDWAKYLNLTQLMCAAEILTAKKIDGQVVYSIKEYGHEKKSKKEITCFRSSQKCCT